MAYHLENTQLRVVHNYVRQQRNKVALQQARIILLEHILPDTEEFIGHISNSGAEIFAIVTKPYSVDADVLSRLKAKNHCIVEYSYQELEESDVLLDLLKEAIAKSKVDSKHILIIEVGGYFARPLTKIDPADAILFAGVVEDTTFGHNRYLKLVSEIPIPVFSVARSPLKEIEARFVGRDAVTAVDQVFRKRGVSIAGRNALVIGYGMIGANVARALRSHDLNVCVYDMHDYKNLRAFIDGFHIHKKRKLIENADIIFAATAAQALGWEEMLECKNNVILASVGSKNTEFDIKTLAQMAISKHPLDEHLVKYGLPNSKNIMVVKDGTAVNFLLRGLPTEVLDLVYSEILVCSLRLLKMENLPGEVHQSKDEFLNGVALDWLRFVNM